MAKVIITTQVEEIGKWEKGFRTHGDLFRSQSISRVDFGLADDNTVAACFEVGDLDTFMRVLDSPETAAAMAFDGVKRETAKIFVLDGEFIP